IRDLGSDGTMTAGLLRGIEDGWFITEIADSAFAYQQELEKGEKRVVGVNTLTGDVSDELEILRVSHEVELAKRQVVADLRGARGRGAGWMECEEEGRAGPVRAGISPRRCSRRHARRPRWARSVTRSGRCGASTGNRCASSRAGCSGEFS